ncbi:MAG: IS1595 family transposase [Pseudomonadota bacterium]
MRQKHSKLTHIQTNKLLEHFVAGTPARTACLLVGLNKITAMEFHHRVRVVIAERLVKEAAELADEIEVDESYFGVVGKGKRGRGVAGKVLVFGLLKLGGRVFVLPVKDTRSDTLIPITACKVQPDSGVYADSFHVYDLLDLTDFHHMRINHSKLFVDRENRINGIENFLNQAKRHLRRYDGIPWQNFHLFIKECESRLNFGPPDQLLKSLHPMLKPYSKSSSS